MQKRSIQPGRPAGSTTYDASLARAFGATVRAVRTEQGIAQETLAHKAGVERSHMGKVERGEHIPSLPLIFKIAGTLGCSVASLLADMESRLAAQNSNGPAAEAKPDVAEDSSTGTNASSGT